MYCINQFEFCFYILLTTFYSIVYFSLIHWFICCIFVSFYLFKYNFYSHFVWTEFKNFAMSWKCRLLNYWISETRTKFFVDLKILYVVYFPLVCSWYEVELLLFRCIHCSVYHCVGVVLDDHMHMSWLTNVNDAVIMRLWLIVVVNCDLCLCVFCVSFPVRIHTARSSVLYTLLLCWLPIRRGYWRIISFVFISWNFNRVKFISEKMWFHDCYCCVVGVVIRRISTLMYFTLSRRHNVHFKKQFLIDWVVW